MFTKVAANDLRPTRVTMTFIQNAVSYASNHEIMITRVWHGRTALERADDYLQFLLNRGTEDYKKVNGNLSVRVWRKLDVDCAHFYTVTEWDNIASIREFAGEQYEKAVYYPEDHGILLEFEEHVQHYESFVI